ncbi:MAG: serine/threonine protein kinase [Chloroflexi bacterium]|nr:MAG: serine/threonine protein kinase [Chloroflexota bacterium]
MATFTLTGQTLGKYHILEPLGSGGMARVYRAFHPQLNRYVAVKVLRSDLVDDDSFSSRFSREAQAVANLRHPNIIQVFDFDVENDITFMVMEMLDGDTLHTRLNDYRVRGEQMPWGDMIRILLDVLDGLAYAHEEGMIHRDIKPANVLLTKRGQAVLADFGIAQMVGGTRHTVSGALLGTLNYMAPEQGLKNICDERTDLYSVGIVLYEMLTRQPPYDADTPLAILMKHVNDPLPLPRSVEPAIPEPFERIVLKALSKQPEDRFQTADEMAQALHTAAKNVEIDIPENISLPLSFSTPTAPTESVAVFSGTSREQLAEMEFTDTAATDAHLEQTLADDIAALKAAESPLVVTGTTGATKIKEAPSKKLTVAQAIVNSIGLTVGGNMLMVMLMGFNSQIWNKGWPVELFLVAGAMAMLMTAVSSIWLLIPTYIILGNGLLFIYYAGTGNWEHWSFLWPLEIFIILGTVWHTINLAQDRKTAVQKSQQIGSLTLRRALIAAGIAILMGLFLS